MDAPHKVDLDEMLEWIDRETTRFASSSVEPKFLEVRLRGGYIVVCRGHLVYEGTDGASAVRAYNEAV